MPAKATIKSGHFIDYRHRKIVFKSWVLKKPVAQIYIIHGFSEHIDNYQDIIPILNNNGFSCHIMDLPGHGFSEGIRGHIDDFRDYTKNLDLFTKSNPYHQAKKPVFLSSSPRKLSSIPFILSGYLMQKFLLFSKNFNKTSKNDIRNYTFFNNLIFIIEEKNSTNLNGDRQWPTY